MQTTGDATSGVAYLFVIFCLKMPLLHQCCQEYCFKLHNFNVWLVNLKCFLHVLSLYQTVSFKRLKIEKNAKISYRANYMLVNLYILLFQMCFSPVEIGIIVPFGSASVFARTPAVPVYVRRSYETMRGRHFARRFVPLGRRRRPLDSLLSLARQQSLCIPLCARTSRPTGKITYVLNNG